MFPAVAQFVLTRAHLPWLIAGALAGYLIVIFTNPVRGCFRDGLSAIRRYPTLWFTFGAFGFAYTLFELLKRLYSASVLPPEERPIFMWLRAAWRDPQLWFTGSPESFWYVPPHGLHEAATEALLPACESVAGIFNNLVSTFPLAAVAAVLLLVNWDGHQMVLLRALRKRFRGWGWLAYAGILLSAFAVIGKLLLYLLPLVHPLDGDSALAYFQWSPVVIWIAFFFEYLFGVCIQIYLILLAYCWVRGLTFQHGALLDFAIRRFAFVVKWALLVLVVSSLFIDLPLILKNFPAFQAWFSVEPETLEKRLRLARSILTGFLLAFATMQITLTFHSESLRRAAGDHARFIRRNWWAFAWFVIVAALHWYGFHVLKLLCTRALGEGTAPGIIWSLCAPWLGGAIGAWLLASWVCLYKSRDHDRGTHELDQILT
jgi:hypothetical protein